jgi:hypothetical protein
MTGRTNIALPRAALSLIAVALTAACAGSGVPSAEALRSERIAQLAKIATNCGLPAEALKLKGVDDLHIRPPADAPYEKVDCLLTALKKTDMPVKMGFVGNETYETGNQR